jgi:hypothetical protein
VMVEPSVVIVVRPATAPAAPEAPETSPVAVKADAAAGVADAEAAEAVPLPEPTREGQSRHTRIRLVCAHHWRSMRDRS